MAIKRKNPTVNELRQMRSKSEWEDVNNMNQYRYDALELPRELLSENMGRTMVGAFAKQSGKDLAINAGKLAAKLGAKSLGAGLTKIAPGVGYANLAWEVGRRANKLRDVNKQIDEQYQAYSDSMKALPEGEKRWNAKAQKTLDNMRDFDRYGGQSAAPRDATTHVSPVLYKGDLSINPNQRVPRAHNSNKGKKNGK